MCVFVMLQQPSVLLCMFETVSMYQNMRVLCGIKQSLRVVACVLLRSVACAVAVGARMCGLRVRGIAWHASHFNVHVCGREHRWVCHPFMVHACTSVYVDYFFAEGLLLHPSRCYE